MAIVIYTDGSAKGNPGRGGYGVVMLSGKHRKEISAGFLLTTNNRMELLAVIVGLESVKKQKSDIIVYSDSKYVVNAVEKGWLFNWQKKNFKGEKPRLVDSFFICLQKAFYPFFVGKRSQQQC